MLTISRPDIHADSIQQFPSNSRFLTLPIENYLSALEVEPIAPQTALINAINSPSYRFVTACLSRRTGKTYIANIIAQCVALMPGVEVLLISPNYSLTTISWDLQRQLIKKFNLEITKNNQKDKVLTLSNGSSIRMGSVGQADSVVGRSYKLILFDEAALSELGRDAFNIQLRPTLDTPNSKAIFISTPRGLHSYFKEFYDRGFSDKFPEWISIHSDYKENPRVSEKDIIEAKNSMSDAEFRQEYMADFTSFQGRIWNFDASECVKDLSDLVANERFMRECDIIAGIDIGFKDPTAFCVIAYHPPTRFYYVINEFLDNEMTTSEQASKIRSLIDGYDIDMIFIDSAAAQTRWDWANTYDIATNSAKKSVLDGIGHVAGIVENNRLIVDYNCVEVLFSLDQYQWDDRKNLIKEKPVHNEACHMADAIRYALYTYTE